MTVSTAAAYRADWLFPVDGPPIRDAVLVVDAAGRIDEVRSGRDAEAIDFGRYAIVPALVNAHVHLEFSDRRDPITPATPFSTWIRNVVAHRRGRGDHVQRILAQGGAEARRSGTAAVGEIQTADTMHYEGLRVDLTLFREIIGPLRQHWPALLDQARQHLTFPPATVSRVGLSPHAPHTVPQELFESLIEIAEENRAPVAVHLAETPEELELLRDGSGELVDMMRSLWMWEPASHPLARKPIDWLRELARASRGLVVHGNYLDAAEVEFLAQNPSLSLVYCPRTHAYFGHPPHPFRDVIAKNGRVALGTDGRSSNPDLSLWREAEFVSRKHPDLPSGTILELATKNGADALGVGDQHGVLKAGRRANFIVVPLDPSANGDVPPNLFATEREGLRVFQDGIEVNQE